MRAHLFLCMHRAVMYAPAWETCISVQIWRPELIIPQHSNFLTGRSVVSNASCWVEISAPQNYINGTFSIWRLVTLELMVFSCVLAGEHWAVTAQHYTRNQVPKASFSGLPNWQGSVGDWPWAERVCSNSAGVVEVLSGKNCLVSL